MKYALNYEEGCCKSSNLEEEAIVFETLEELFDYAEQEFTVCDAYNDELVIYEFDEDKGFKKIGYVAPAPRKFIFVPNR